MELTKIFQIFIISAFVLSCAKKDEPILVNNYIYNYDTFKFNNSGNISIQKLYSSIRNDSIYILEEFSESCKIEWLIGILKDNNEAFSLSNICNSTTIIYNLRSKVDSIYYTKPKKDSIYRFKIKLGINSYLSEERIRTMLFSKQDGIILIEKNDTISLPPFY